jgi:hypothetical protein
MTSSDVGEQATRNGLCCIIGTLLALVVNRVTLLSRFGEASHDQKVTT